MSKKNGTKTSSFGNGSRENHDASFFYASRMYQEHLQEDAGGEYRENPLPADCLDRIFTASASSMHQLPDASVHLMVTSPPYNVRKEYDHDLTLDEYLALLKDVFSETYRVLVPGGRACINVANLGRKPYIPINASISQLMVGLGFLMRGEIIWDKAASAGSSTAWGSWLSPSNPTLRDVHEYILVFSKGRFKRESLGREATITKDEFLSYTKSIWSFPTVSAKKIGHPAPFPEELPRRLMQLYTYAGEIVLDPFMGSGTTALAAIESGRHYVGYEINEDYAALAEGRIKEMSLEDG
ncbi:MAG: site-specific DNA-methyltransferase [Anaerolineae bacterium]|nr:site-specific DNA-methyltransferase [Anaerolineae bacterium]